MLCSLARALAVEQMTRLGVNKSIYDQLMTTARHQVDVGDIL